jgi:GTP-binding protein HflX
MIENKSEEKERGILIAVKTREVLRERVEENLDELERLAETANAQILFRVIQEKNRIDPAYFIGKGKVEELAQLAEMNEVTTLIFDDDLNPTQVRNLEKIINRKIIDRSGLILDIFASHAKTKEAKTQVELAQMEYMLSRLTRAWTHLSKQYGGIGTKGPGEKQIETDRRLIRRRIKILKDKLKKIEEQQLTKSLKRKEFVTAAMVGYTNAGKSTLLNSLTDANVYAEDKLFATLDSTTRSLTFGKNKRMLVSDTVGFIRKLPHTLIASFKSTLNVVAQADLILHVVDISHPFFEDHIEVVNKTLEELNCSEKPQLLIFNKIDLLEEKERLEYVHNKYENSLVVSARKGMNLNKLLKRLEEFYEKNFVERELQLESSDSKLISQIHERGEVLFLKYKDDKVLIKFKMNKKNYNQLFGEEK